VPNRILVLLTLVLSVGLAGCASHDTSVGRFKVGKPYSVGGRTYYPEENYTSEETGIASWYGPGFNGRKTANGERFDENELTAAHRTLQLPSLVRVTNLENGKSIIVRVTDRGPFHSNRVIDVTKKAAELLGFRNVGTAKVKLQVLGPESKALAEAAKRKIDTKGAEIAMNNTGMLDERFAGFYPAGSQPAVTPEMVASLDNPRQPYEPASAVEQAVAYNTVGASALNPPVADGSMPDAPDMPARLPIHEAIGSVEPAITRTRPGGARNPGIPVATLEPEDLAPRPAYTDTSNIHVDVVPVSPSQIYVQAGSFVSQSNARKTLEQVASLGPSKVVSASVGGQPYYRVRIGPIESVDKADLLVNTLHRQGRQATIIVTEN